MANIAKRRRKRMNPMSTTGKVVLGAGAVAGVTLGALLAREGVKKGKSVAFSTAFGTLLAAIITTTGAAVAFEVV